MDNVENLFDALYSAVVSAQKSVENDYINKLQSDYFEGDKPKTVTLQLGEKKIEVPKFCLVPHNSLKISEVDIAFEVNLNHDNKKGSLGCLGKLRNGKQMANVQIKFKEADSPEGLCRINDNLVAQIPTV